MEIDVHRRRNIPNYKQESVKKSNRTLSGFLTEELPMDIREAMKKRDHEQLVVFNDPEVGLFGFIAIHDTTLGPALGGCRMWPYETTEQAFIDVLRLSRGMTYKASLAGLNLGGGKAVIIGDPKKDKTEALLRSFGQYIDGLGGRYITAEDVGTTVKDMEVVMKETGHVAGIPAMHGGSGDPSPFTALGVFQGIRACQYYLHSTNSLKGVSVAVQGVGNVGSHLVKLLVEEGAKVFVSDIDPEKIRQITHAYSGVKAVASDEIVGLGVDVFAPCAMGAIINDDTVELIKAKIVAGAANNQLKEDRHGEILWKKGVVYAPDYCINAGGLISVYGELLGYDADRARSITRRLYDTLLDVFKKAKEQNVPNSKAADMLAMERVLKARQMKGKSFRHSFHK